jgi:hypothetical protein
MNPVVLLVIQYAVQYGIPAAQEIIAVLKKPDATLADVEVLFAKIQPYEALGIPNVSLKPEA